MDQPDKRQRARSLLLAAQHQLRQPLNALSLLVGELRQGPSARDIAAIADDMRYALQLSHRWLEALVELERAEQGLLEPELRAVPLQGVFDRLREAFAPRCAEHGLDLRVVPSSATVRADPVLLHRILAELLDNAVKFTPAGKLLVGCRRAGGSLRVEVRDSGPGLSPEETAVLFDPFVRLENEVRPRERGLGLGLAYARCLAAFTDAGLTVTGRPGRGSCFALTLPPGHGGRDTAACAAAGADALGNPLAGAEVVLLDGGDCAALRGDLESWGAVVRVVAPAALSAALAERPRLLLADSDSFAAAGGWQLARAGQTAIVLVGGEAARTAADSGLHSLQRPIRPARLRALCHFAITQAADLQGAGSGPADQ